MKKSEAIPSYFPRSDLASECAASLERQIDGIQTQTEKNDLANIIRTKITTKEAASLIEKPLGNYVSIECSPLFSYSAEQFHSLCALCATEISRLIPQSGSCLVACLGNRNITSDATGPLAADYFLVTRHLKKENPKILENLGLRESMCIIPDVLGKTGLESAKIIASIAEKEKPDFIVVVDCLASRSIERLSRTIQICDTGITPGSGVGNHRLSLNKDTLGIPVFAIGIPTVIDVATIGTDILCGISEKYSIEIDDNEKNELLHEILNSGTYNYFVTPKNCDIIASLSSRLIGLSLTKALNPQLSFEDIYELCGKT